MPRDDPERDRLRDGVGFAPVLESFCWKLDRGESTRAAPKNRRGPGEIIIVNHRGHGCWDPQSTAVAMFLRWSSISTPAQISAPSGASCNR